MSNFGPYFSRKVECKEKDHLYAQMQNLKGFFSFTLSNSERHLGGCITRLLPSYSAVEVLFVLDRCFFVFQSVLSLSSPSNNFKPLDILIVAIMNLKI